MNPYSRLLNRKKIPVPSSSNPTSIRPIVRANTITPLSPGSHYLASNYTTIYNFPEPPTTPIVFGVISVGGGLFGTTSPVSGNIVSSTGTKGSAVSTLQLTKGDIFNYLTACRISTKPTIYIVQQGITNKFSASAPSSIENTLDIATIAACCPGPKVTIVLYLSNSINTAFRSAISGTYINGVLVKPNVISCSWGAPEFAWTTSDLTGASGLNSILSKSTVPICVASGDTGASGGGASGFNVDYPGSSPYVVACGGTSLYNPTLDYSGNVSEVAWSGGGGGFSAHFSKPAWQPANPANKRSVPDIAMNADPNTGVRFLVGGSYTVIGGTSIVAPVMAALIGCIGPASVTCATLYAATDAFNDIDAGNNFGYIAVPGFDQCTGLGSPNGRLLKIAAAAAAMAKAKV